MKKKEYLFIEYLETIKYQLEALIPNIEMKPYAELQV